MAPHLVSMFGVEVGVAGSGFNTYRCRVRASGSTITLECIAPSPAAAAYATAREELKTGVAPWVQVTVAEWSGALGEFIEPENVVIFSREDPPPPGAVDVILTTTIRRRAAVQD